MTATMPGTDGVSFEGTTLDDTYVVLGRLAGRDEQSMFLGRHLSLGFPVVVRFELPSSSRGELEAEAGALTKLEHPTIPRLLGRGAIERRGQSVPYLLRRYATGVALDVLIQSQHRLAPLRSVRVVGQVLDALAHMHDRGLFHGDLKPSNIIVDPEDGDRTSLIDFGAAWTVGSQTGPRRATPRYCAPEVLAGQAPTSASDVFAAGCVLRACLLGRAAWLGDEARQALPLPPAVWTVLDRATHPHPASRFTTPAAMLEALHQLPERELADWELGRFPGSAPLDEPTADLEEVVAPHPGRGPAPVRGEFELESMHKPSVWVLTGGTVMTKESIVQAVTWLSHRFDVEVLDEDERFGRHLELQQGLTRPPWVVLFSDEHALSDDALLQDLCSNGGTLRMLICSRSSLELMQTAINRAGVDQHIALPTDAESIQRSVLRLVDRAARRHRYVDGLRVAVADAAHAASTSFDPHSSGSSS